MDAKISSMKPSCLSCRYYLPRTSKVGILHTNGKGFKLVIEMGCEQHAPAVKYLGPCSSYEREPGSDDA